MFISLLVEDCVNADFVPELDHPDTSLI